MVVKVIWWYYSYITFIYDTNASHITVSASKVPLVFDFSDSIAFNEFSVTNHGETKKSKPVSHFPRVVINPVNESSTGAKLIMPELQTKQKHFRIFWISSNSAASN
mmetsp:Transcript_59044/g.69013  ORF Transcript_59044/g.69013 Transcript_59044/m.69013 type:complete len:106 (+) Transcript_59044:1-318(+)